MALRSHRQATPIGPPIGPPGSKGCLANPPHEPPAPDQHSCGKELSIYYIYIYMYICMYICGIVDRQYDVYVYIYIHIHSFLQRVFSMPLYLPYGNQDS